MIIFGDLTALHNFIAQYVEEVEGLGDVWVREMNTLTQVLFVAVSPRKTDNSMELWDLFVAIMQCRFYRVQERARSRLPNVPASVTDSMGKRLIAPPVGELGLVGVVSVHLSLAVSPASDQSSSRHPASTQLTFRQCRLSLFVLRHHATHVLDESVSELLRSPKQRYCFLHAARVAHTPFH